MAKAPKNELAIKAVIAKIVTDKTSMKTKAIENIRLKSKTWDLIKNGSGNNVAIQSESITFWTIVAGKQTEDYTAFETAINEAKNNAFNSLDIVSVRENMTEANYQRIYEIKVN
jgi:hypothetical protein